MNKEINTAMVDAFSETESGQILVIEAKAIGPRVTNLKELAHDTIVEMTKTTRWYHKRFHWIMQERVKANKPTVQTPFHLFKAAKPVLKEIAVQGGKEYSSAHMTLQFTWDSHESLQDTVNLILG